MCWFGNVSQKDKNNLQRILNISSKVIDFKQSTLTALYEKQVLRKSTKIINDDTHILFYITSTSFCPRPEGSELSRLKQIGSVAHLFQCLLNDKSL